MARRASAPAVRRLKLVWTRTAARDRRLIREHIAGDSPRAALRLDVLISERAGLLADQPRLGRPGRVEGTRELVVHPSYVLVYDVTEDAVRVLRLLHAARRWPAGG